jgi:hypothetical protein
MNEQIKELALASHITIGDYSYCETIVNVEKFAKLIINECISQIVKVSDRHTDQYIDAALRDAVWEIENYFGE